MFFSLDTTSKFCFHLLIFKFYIISQVCFPFSPWRYVINATQKSVNKHRYWLAVSFLRPIFKNQFLVYLLTNRPGRLLQSVDSLTVKNGSKVRFPVLSLIFRQKDISTAILTLPLIPGHLRIEVVSSDEKD